MYSEGESIVVYSPSLELSGYGDTKNEATESFKYILEDFFKSSLENNQLALTLVDLKWEFEKDEHPDQLDHGIFSKDKMFLAPIATPSEMIEFATELDCE